MNKIEKYLLEHNIKPHYSGFGQLKNAINLVLQDKTYMQQRVNRLYNEISKIHNVSIYGVERSMRYALIQSGIKTTIGEFIARAVIELKGETK